MSSIFEPLKMITATPFYLEGENIDTDQILPAKFLSITSRDGLAGTAFYDWRHDDKGDIIEGHKLNQLSGQDRRIFIVDKNFGCGSSREHAQWALYSYGVRVIIGEAIADIFKSNCLKNGIAAISLNAGEIKKIKTLAGVALTVDLQSKHIVMKKNAAIPFQMDALSRKCLIAGTDQLSILMEAKHEIISYENNRSIYSD